MNLEDFKSFRRALITPEVGSIPTHSRQTLRWAALVTTVLLWGPAARAQDPPAPAEGAAPAPPPAPAAALVPAGTPGAFQRAVRSAVFPAWGQLTNGKSKKAVVLFSVQSYLLTRIVQESRAASASQRRADQLGSAASEDAEAAAAQEIALASADEHYAVRRDMIFWMIVAGIYGALDAYVDANLGDFGGELEENRGLFAAADPADRSVELGIRF